MPAQPLSSRAIMLVVAGCLVPGLVIQGLATDPAGVAGNVVLAVLTVLATETVCLRLRGRTSGAGSIDAAGLVTALILAAALPPGASVAVIWAAALAVTLGKHVYGGTGHNTFNPAMVGYAIVLVSFPATLSSWPGEADALSGATTLTAFKYRGGATVDDIWLAENGFGVLGSAGYEWAAAAYLLGGLVLMGLRLAAWRPALGMLGSIAVLATLGYDNGSSSSLGSPLYHWFSGATLLAACFVVTDPVTHPTSPAGQWLFGLLVGAVTVLIRSFGNYPDGIAFAILLANAVSPWLDQKLLRQAGVRHD